MVPRLATWSILGSLLLGCEDTRLVAERGGALPLRCDPGPVGDVVARYSFDEAPGAEGFADETGAHPAQVTGNVARVEGPEGCGQAVVFPQGDPRGYLVVAPSSAFALPSGSLSFWVWLPPPPGPVFRVGILSRDATLETTKGHFTVYWTGPGYLSVRLQGANAGGSRCTARVMPTETWTHVGINFGDGPLELYINGIEENSRNEAIFVPTAPCGSETSDGLGGNANPWVFGANNDGSMDGLADAPSDFAASVRLDEILLSSQRRAFRR